jgi:fructokinase
VNAVDTTGAGDAFVAGLLHGVLARAANPSLFDELTQWGEILHFANTVGALTTTRRGAIPSLPSRAEVEVLLSSVG